MKKDGIGCSKLKVKLLNYPNDIKLPLVSFLSQTWGPTFNLDSYTSDEITNIKWENITNCFGMFKFYFSN